MVVALLGANVPACMARQNASVEKSIMTLMDRYTNWSHAANDFLKLADSDDDFACFNMKFHIMQSENYYTLYFVL